MSALRAGFWGCGFSLSADKQNSALSAVKASVQIALNTLLLECKIPQF